MNLCFLIGKLSLELAVVLICLETAQHIKWNTNQSTLEYLRKHFSNFNKTVTIFSKIYKEYFNCQQKGNTDLVL